MENARHALARSLAALGIADLRVLDALATVPRHLFVPSHLAAAAYDNTSLGIGSGQTISQPYVVALMTELLAPGEHDTVLEVGTGSGYQTAILCHLAGRVLSVEQNATLHRSARERLATLGYDAATLVHGDGSVGLPAHSPFDGIIVTAASPRITPTLLEQLADGGRLVIPIGDREEQILQRIERSGNRYRVQEHAAVRFVPLVGAEGWRE